MISSNLVKAIVGVTNVSHLYAVAVTVFLVLHAPKQWHSLMQSASHTVIPRDGVKK